MDDAPAVGWGNGAVNAQMISDMSALVNSVRAVSRLPLSVSIKVASAAAMGLNQYIDLQYAIALDFHDIHLYCTASRPAVTDGAVLESRAKFLGSYIIGEMGRAISNGAADQLSWFNGIGDVQRRPLCKGTVMFGLTNFDTAGGTDDYGIYLTTDPSFTAPRQGMLVPFQNWVGL